MVGDVRLRWLRIVLVVVGVTFIVGVYPLTVLWPSGWSGGQGASCSSSRAFTRGRGRRRRWPRRCEVVAPTRAEPGCRGIEAFRSTRDSRLFYIHSRWVDEAAFDHHAGLPHTVRFVERVTRLVDPARDVQRTEPIG